MRALTVEPGIVGSARLDEHPAAMAEPGHLVVETLLVGVCGTDAEIVAGAYGTAPPGEDRLVLGHEAVCRIVQADPGRHAGPEFAAGDVIVPIVRRPDPVPCEACAVGEWDMCRNGRYTEHGIRAAHGFARERFDLDPSFAVPVPPSLGQLAVLVEPASVVAKAWEQIERIAARTQWDPTVVLVTGAGPIGLLAAMMARQRGLETHVLDRVTSGPKPGLVAHIGATYHTGPIGDTCPVPDIVVECTGAGALVLDAMAHTSPTGIVCLTGMSSGSHSIALDAAALNRRLVLENDVVFGTVNANRRHYETAVAALDAADRGWLGAILTRRVPLHSWRDALERRPDDVKVAIEISS